MPWPQTERPPANAPAQRRQRPESLRLLFLAFSSLALQGFGGVLTVVQRELVDNKQWLTPAEFVEDWTVAQILPGPNVVNLALILGDRYFGLRGALVAVAGLFAMPLLLVLALTLAYQQFLHVEAVRGALRGMGAVAAGLIMATGVKLLPSLRLNPMGRAVGVALVLLTFAGVALLHWPLFAALLIIGTPAYAWAWHRIRRADERAASRAAASPAASAPDQQP